MPLFGGTPFDTDVGELKRIHSMVSTFRSNLALAFQMNVDLLGVVVNMRHVEFVMIIMMMLIEVYFPLLT